MWLLCGWSVVVTRLSCDCCAVVAWLSTDSRVVVKWLSTACCRVVVVWLCGDCVIIVWLSCGCRLVVEWLSCGCCVVAKNEFVSSQGMSQINPRNLHVYNIPIHVLYYYAVQLHVPGLSPLMCNNRIGTQKHPFHYYYILHGLEKLIELHSALNISRCVEANSRCGDLSGRLAIAVHVATWTLDRDTWRMGWQLDQESVLTEK